MEQSSTKYPKPCKRLLPWEIIESILLRLPVKSLGRFKSVSKTWNSIISDPRSIKTHLTHTTKKILLIAFSTTPRYLCSIKLTIHNCHADAVPATLTEFTFISPTSRWKYIMGSCNGLVLARVVNMGPLYLMNPTTHHAWKLPKNPFEIFSDVCYGFGYDSSTDDYKVVCICFFSRRGVSVDSVSIYSVRSGSWRKLLTNAVPHAQPYFYTSRALVDDKCHWFAHSPPSVIAFSFMDEVFTEIRLPDLLQGKGKDLCCDVVEIGGKLAVYSSVRDGVYGYQLWVMQEYGDAKSWTRVCSISHRDGWMMPICLVEGSDQDLVLQSENKDGVVVFNIDERKRKIVRIIGGPGKISSIGGTFVESIESIERINTTTQRVSGSTKVMDN